MMIVLGADHRGFEEKNRIKNILIEKGFHVEDLGAEQKNPQDDFPLFAKQVADAVAKDSSNEKRGVLFCGSGVGMSIAANRVKRVRAGLGFSADQIKAARHDDDINILVIPVDFLSEDIVNDIVYAFLHTEFAKEEKYLRRKQELDEVERYT